jgi:ABC-2 type transport system permease protein
MTVGTETHSSRTLQRAAFATLLRRDALVLRKNLREFLPRTILQPVLLMFVFTYVMPEIGLAVGGEAGAELFTTLLVAGVVGSTILFQGIQGVALPLVQDFGYTREIEDRVMAPLPVEGVALAKIVSGAVQCLIGGLVVFPLAAVVPATDVSLAVDWPVVLTIIPLACVMAASMGLLFGVIFDPRTLPLMFGIIVVPLTFLGCVYYQWSALEEIRWLQILVLANPLVYICEGARAALTDVDHMSLWAVYPVMISFTAVMAAVGVTRFRSRVVS